MDIVEMLKPTEGEECQWLGVYVTRWRREWGEPSVMFRDVGTAEIAQIPEVDKLVKIARDARDYLYYREGNDDDEEQGLVTRINVALDDLGVTR